MITATFDPKKIAMKKVELPQQIKFAKGEVICGELLSVEKIRLKEGGIASKYVMRSMDSDRRFQFLGTNQLDQMLSPDYVGHYLEIVYMGDDANVVRNGRGMMVFEVARSEHPVSPRGPVGQQLEDGTYITDKDIPF